MIIQQIKGTKPLRKIWSLRQYCPEWDKLCQIPNKCQLNTVKVPIIPVNIQILNYQEKLAQLGLSEDDKCEFCEDIEIIELKIYYHCGNTMVLWLTIEKWTKSITQYKVYFDKEPVILAKNTDSLLVNQIYLLENIISIKTNGRVNTSVTQLQKDISKYMDLKNI